MNLTQAIEEFLRELRRKGYSPRTVEAYDFEFRELLVFFEKYLEIQEKELDLNAFSTDNLRAYVDAALFKNRLSPKTLARKVAAIKSLSKHLYRENFISTNVADRISLPRTPKTLPKALSQDEVRQLVQSLDPKEKDFLRNRLVLIMLYSTGLRVSELCNLTLGRINIELNHINVFGKGAKERIIPLTSTCRNAIFDYLDYKEKTLKLANHPSEKLFMKSATKPMTVRMAQYIVEKSGKKCGFLTKTHPHLLRHSIATHMIEAGGSIESVRETLGHEDLSTTSIYLKTSQKFLQQEHKKFNPTDKLLS